MKLLFKDILVKNPKERITLDEIWESGWVSDFFNPPERVDSETNQARINKAKQVHDVKINFNKAKFSKNRLHVTEMDLREAVLTITSDSGDTENIK